MRHGVQNLAFTLTRGVCPAVVRTSCRLALPCGHLMILPVLKKNLIKIEVKLQNLLCIRMEDMLINHV